MALFKKLHVDVTIFKFLVELNVKLLVIKLMTITFQGLFDEHINQ